MRILGVTSVSVAALGSAGRVFRPPPLRFRALPQALLLAILFVMTAGCASVNWLSVIDYATPEIASVRHTPTNPLTQTLKLMSRKGPQPTDRTKQLLRKYDLSSKSDSDPRDVLIELQQIISDNPSPENIYAYAELSYIFGVKAQENKNDELAFDMFGASVVSAYAYLFDPQYDQYRNPYDPQFRRASDLYNESLEGVLRIANRRGLLKPGMQHGIKSGSHAFDVVVTLKGPWQDDEIDHFEFVSDYEVTGLTNQYQTYGLGVPMIAVRKSRENEEPADSYYPEGLTFAVTAFLRVEEFADGHDGHCKLELYDPLTDTNILVNNRLAPLETNLSTPLAVFLNQPLLRTEFLATFGLLDAQAGQAYRGVYMLEPYDPNKIPVMMVHGLWSSPVTWMEMFNDLRAAPDIRNRYQFWFYLYPTGQPFWISATQMRNDLANMRQKIDPQGTSIPLRQMVLIGHSMGGLVSTFQTLESRTDFWNLVSSNPFEELTGDEETKTTLGQTLFFHPSQSVRRVVTIATPHRGSYFANSATRYVGRSLIKLPKIIKDTSRKVIRDNPGFFTNTDLLTITTSIDSLAPDSPILPAMLEAPHASWVTYHNIIGEAPDEGFLGRFTKGGDGVVTIESAHLDNAVSEIRVPSLHSAVHSHPRAILEVQRILREHSRQMFAETSYTHRRAMPAGFTPPRHGTLPLEKTATPAQPPSGQLPAPARRAMVPFGPTAPAVPGTPFTPTVPFTPAAPATPPRMLETPPLAPLPRAARDEE